MKVVHHVLRYLPQTIDGIVVFVKDLTQELGRLGIENKIVAPLYGTQSDYYKLDGIEVYRYPYLPKGQKIKLQFDSQGKQEYRDLPLTENLAEWVEPHQGLAEFANWLKKENPDIYHLHNWKPSCGLFHLRIAKQLGLKTIVTLHSPNPICSRGTMMFQGKQPCEGLIDVKRCRSCCGSALPGWANQLWSRVPVVMSNTFSPMAIANTLTYTTLVEYRRQTLAELGKLTDCLTVPCQWLYDSLLLNGLPTQKLQVCRYGVTQTRETTSFSAKKTDRVLTIGYLGRWSKSKGLEILIEAIQNLPSTIAVKLIIHGVATSVEEQEFRSKAMALVAQEPRIEIQQPLSRQEVAKTIESFDLLAVPSQWLETGPLVVLEAQEVKTPVLGSNLGGIGELIRHEVDGWLIPQAAIADPVAWSQAIAYLAENPTLIDNMRQNIPPVRTMQQAAQDFSKLYAAIKENVESICCLNKGSEPNLLIDSYSS